MCRSFVHHRPRLLHCCSQKAQLHVAPSITIDLAGEIGSVRLVYRGKNLMRRTQHFEQRVRETMFGSY
jgi:hypothetical protein